MRTIAVTIALILLINGAGFAAGDAAAGKELFAKKCTSCHGAGGEGKDAIAKMMKVEMKPLASKEVQEKSEADLVKVITTGSGKMKAVADLKEKDVQDVIAFLRTLAKK